MDTNGFGRMLGRGFGSLIKNVDANKLINTLEQKMVEGADAVKRAIDDPKAAADKLSQQTENLKKAFQEGYAETMQGTDKTDASGSTKLAESSEPASHAAAERPSEPTKP